MISSDVPDGPGSVAGAPNLPDGFASTFTSRYVDAGDLRQHVVTGGDGPPLLLVHGWPQTWYAWRLVMPALARDFQVIVPDQRGTGLSGKPEDGYDTGTLAGDLAALMDALGHDRFAVAGHDTGMWIGYALAADHPSRVDRLAVAETPLPGVSPSPPLFASAHLNNALWHFAFNRLAAVNDQLTQGREHWRSVMSRFCGMAACSDWLAVTSCSRRPGRVRAVRLLFRLRFVILTSAGGALRLLFAVSRVVSTCFALPGHAGIPARRCRAGLGGLLGQAAGGAFGCAAGVPAGSGSRCSRVAAGTAWRLLRVLTFLMVNRG
jgi:pimeloyl-ACP methyl ester carboxylesterase